MRNIQIAVFAILLSSLLLAQHSKTFEFDEPERIQSYQSSDSIKAIVTYNNLLGDFYLNVFNANNNLIFKDNMENYGKVLKTAYPVNDGIIILVFVGGHPLDTSNDSIVGFNMNTGEELWKTLTSAGDYTISSNNEYLLKNYVAENNKPNCGVIRLSDGKLINLSSEHREYFSSWISHSKFICFEPVYKQIKNDEEDSVANSVRTGRHGRRVRGGKGNRVEFDHTNIKLCEIITKDNATQIIALDSTTINYYISGRPLAPARSIMLNENLYFTAKENAKINDEPAYIMLTDEDLILTSLTNIPDLEFSSLGDFVELGGKAYFKYGNKQMVTYLVDLETGELLLYDSEKMDELFQEFKQKYWDVVWYIDNEEVFVYSGARKIKFKK